MLLDQPIQIVASGPVAAAETPDEVIKVMLEAALKLVEVAPPVAPSDQAKELARGASRDTAHRHGVEAEARAEALTDRCQRKFGRTWAYKLLLHVTFKPDRRWLLNLRRMLGRSSGQ